MLMSRSASDVKKGIASSNSQGDESLHESAVFKKSYTYIYIYTHVIYIYTCYIYIYIHSIYLYSICSNASVAMACDQVI